MQKIQISRMEIVYRWETGDVARMYSPKDKKCSSNLKKSIGGFLVSLGATVLFGRKGWKTCLNQVEEN